MANERRNTQNNASVLTAPAKRRAKKQMPTWMGTAILCGVLLLLVLIVTFAVLSSNGTFKRMYTVAESENFKVSVPMMSYLVYTEYQNLVATYEQFSQQWNTTLAIPGGDGGNSLDKTKPLSRWGLLSPANL